MQSAEIELKFSIVDAEALQAELRPVGFRLDTPRTFEANTLYDTPERMLRGAGQILRLRQYGSLWTLTHKRHPDEEDMGSRYKVRVETETHVEDGAAMQEILRQLGYEAVFRYEKFRTEWSAGAGHLVIDETPIGIWGELEGPTGWIDEMLGRLRVDAAACTTESYGRLFLRWKEQTGSRSRDLTFDLPVEEVELLQVVGGV